MLEKIIRDVVVILHRAHSTLRKKPDGFRRLFAANVTSPAGQSQPTPAIPSTAGRITRCYKELQGGVAPDVARMLAMADDSGPMPEPDVRAE